jgi:hypothetical protein
MFEGGPRRWGVSQMDALGAQAQARCEDATRPRFQGARSYGASMQSPGRFGEITIILYRGHEFGGAGSRQEVVVQDGARGGPGACLHTRTKCTRCTRCTTITRMSTLGQGLAHVEFECESGQPDEVPHVRCWTAPLHSRRHQFPFPQRVQRQCSKFQQPSLKPTLHFIEASWPCFDMRIPLSCG